MSYDYEDDDYGDSSYFIGCTCDHSEDEHGWGHCGVDDCRCEGGWEE